MNLKELYKYYGHLEDHQWRHYNDALGCWIYNREHYFSELKRRGMVPYEEALQLCERHKKNKPEIKKGLSDTAIRIINSLRNSVDKNGNIKLSEYPRAVKALKELGVDFDNKYKPKDFNPCEGGFN